MKATVVRIKENNITIKVDNKLIIFRYLNRRTIKEVLLQEESKVIPLAVYDKKLQTLSSQNKLLEKYIVKFGLLLNKNDFHNIIRSILNTQEDIEFDNMIEFENTTTKIISDSNRLEYYICSEEPPYDMINITELNIEMIKAINSIITNNISQTNKSLDVYYINRMYKIVLNDNYTMEIINPFNNNLGIIVSNTHDKRRSIKFTLLNLYNEENSKDIIVGEVKRILNSMTEGILPNKYDFDILVTYICDYIKKYLNIWIKPERYIETYTVNDTEILLTKKSPDIFELHSKEESNKRLEVVFVKEWNKVSIKVNELMYNNKINTYNILKTEECEKLVKHSLERK